MPEPLRVYVPCHRLADWTEAVVLDSAGWPHPVTAGTLTLVDGRLCLTADVLRRHAGRARVRFADGSECWVKPHPCWTYDPDLGPARTWRQLGVYHPPAELSA